MLDILFFKNSEILLMFLINQNWISVTLGSVAINLLEALFDSLKLYLLFLLDFQSILYP